MSTSEQMTEHPCRASVRATADPIPDAAPVMTALRPARFSHVDVMLRRLRFMRVFGDTFLYVRALALFGVHARANLNVPQSLLDGIELDSVIRRSVLINFFLK